MVKMCMPSSGTCMISCRSSSSPNRLLLDPHRLAITDNESCPVPSWFSLFVPRRFARHRPSLGSGSTLTLSLFDMLRCACHYPKISPGVPAAPLVMSRLWRSLDRPPSASAMSAASRASCGTAYLALRGLCQPSAALATRCWPASESRASAWADPRSAALAAHWPPVYTRQGARAWRRWARGPPH